MRDTLDGVIKLLKYTTLSFQSPISTNVAGRGDVHNCVLTRAGNVAVKFYNHREGPYY